MVLGTVSVSTTLIQGVHGIELKYCAAALISSSVMALAKLAMRTALAFLGSALLRAPFLKSFEGLHEIRIGQAGDAGILGAALAVGIVAQAAGQAHGRLPCATMSGICG